MLSICFEDKGKVQTRSIPEPRIESESDCIVRVDMAGLCGSDMHPYWGRETGLDPGTVMGHEFVGTVIEKGGQVESLAVGDRVFSPFSSSCGQCFFCTNKLPSRCTTGQLFGWRSAGQGLHGGQAEYVRVPLADGTLVKVAPTMTNELALLLGDNLSTGYFCTELAETKPDGVYAIIGCGNVGLMAIVSAQAKGCHQLVAVDPVAERRQLAEQLGVRSVESELAAERLISDLTHGRGADGVLELVGVPAAQRLAYRLVRPGGNIATVGCHCDPHFAFSPAEAYDKNITYRTGRCPARYYMQELASSQLIDTIDTAMFVTHHFELQEGARAYEQFSSRSGGIVKAVFNAH